MRKTNRNQMMDLIKKGFWILAFLLIPTTISAQDSVHVNLQKALEIALSENPTIKIANRTIESKKYYKDEQIAALFPSVSASASYQRTVKKQKMTMEFGGSPMEIEVGTSNNYVAGLNFSLPLVAAPTWYNLKLSQIDVQNAIESARSSKIALINQVKSAYYGLLLAQDSYRVLQINFANVEMTAKNINDKYEQGLASDFDKLRADVQVANQKPQLTSAQQAVNLSAMMLKVLIGVDVTEPIIFDGHLSDFENEMLNYKVVDGQLISLANNTDLRQLELSQEQLNTSLKLIKASSCPTLAFSGNYQYMTMANDFDFANYNWFPYSVIGLSLNVPILSWVGTSYKIKETKITMANLEDQKKYLENNLRVSVNSNLDNIRNAIAEMTSNKETMMQAERAYNIVQKQFEVGMATWLDLNSAELAMTQSQLLYHQSIYNFLTAKNELEKLMGNIE
ncbi:MAG: TolC family protein [Bacteroidales bacterium]|nr:TolC family protein [Bacteroidales bacterium]MDD6583126.1 TolC family protein [Bacteroidales bacterium]